MEDSLKQEIIEFINDRFSSYTNSSVFQNWKLQAEICRDAVNQKWRTGEQLTRSGFYFSSLAAIRDGWNDGLADIFGQANPIVTFHPRRGVEDALVDSAQEMFSNSWADADGLMQWLSLLTDAVDFGMGVGYISWCKSYAEQQVPKVKKVAWGEMLEWQEEFAEMMARPDIERIHPLNWRGDIEKSTNLSWEGCEWKLSMMDLYEHQSNPNFDSQALQNVMDKLAKGDAGQGSGTYYNTVEAQSGTTKSHNKQEVFGKEYWGDLSGVSAFKNVAAEFVVYVVEGEIVRFNINPIVTKKRFRPFYRTRLSPHNDLPLGRNVLIPTMPHQKIKNLILNLGIDDVVMRQHLGLAVWPEQLKNPNDLLNPEGARGVVFMKEGARPDLLPRFFADSRSGTLSDAIQMDGIVDRDSQLSNLNQSTLGLSGGQQGSTATESRYLANTGSRRLRTAAMRASETGLQPMVQHIMLLTLQNNPPEDLGIDPRRQVDILNNNFWSISDTISTDPAQEFAAMSQFGQIAMQQMAQMAPQDGNMNHVVEFIRDTARALRIPSYRVDKYFPKKQPPIDVGMPPAPQGGAPELPQELPPELQGTPAGDIPDAKVPEVPEVRQM